MDLNTLNFKIKNNVAIIELNRPKQYNSLNQAMAEDLFKVSLECEDNSEIRSVRSQLKPPSFSEGRPKCP